MLFPPLFKVQYLRGTLCWSHIGYGAPAPSTSAHLGSSSDKCLCEGSANMHGNLFRAVELDGFYLPICSSAVLHQNLHQNCPFTECQCAAVSTHTVANAASS